jgi:hypothetical protein
MGGIDLYVIPYVVVSDGWAKRFVHGITEEMVSILLNMWSSLAMCSYCTPELESTCPKPSKGDDGVGD